MTMARGKDIFKDRKTDSAQKTFTYSLKVAFAEDKKFTARIKIHLNGKKKPIFSFTTSQEVTEL